MTKDLYSILELDSSCSTDDIRKAYKKLALKYHPDKTDGSYEHFIDVQNAYQVLSNANERERYDNLNHNEKLELYDALKYYLKQVIPNFDNYVKLFFTTETGLKDNLCKLNFNEIFNNVLNRISHIDFPHDLNIYDTVNISLNDKLLNVEQEIIINRTTKPSLTKHISPRENIIIIPGEGEYNEYLNKHGDVVINVDISDEKYTIIGHDIYSQHVISLYEYLYGGTLNVHYPEGDFDVEFNSFVDKFPLITINDRGLHYDDSKRGDLLIELKMRDLSAIKDQIKNLCDSYNV